MKSTKLKTKTEKGITLIALIITIVVLMILAAVAINSITNEGILEQAESTANTYNQAAANEQSSLLDYEDMLTAANGGYETYELGDIVKVVVGSEIHKFYVIEDKTSLGKVVLLAQKNINTDTLVQDGKDNYVAFSTDYSYFDDFSGGITDYPESDFGDEGPYALRSAYNYGVKLGGKGRLLTWFEAEDLRETDFWLYDDPGIIFGVIETSFWLGSAISARAMAVDNKTEFDTVVVDPTEANYGVRPVVEISKSKVTLLGNLFDV